MKVAETLSLDKNQQRKVAKEVKKIKNKVKSGKITIKQHFKKQPKKPEVERGLVFISHLPHGFYEEEIRDYFTQFGKLTNVKVCRSRNSGNSKGYGYVEFEHPEVAKIAAESMNNYLMFKKRLTAEFVEPEKRPHKLFIGRQSKPEQYTKLRRQRRNFACKNKKVDEETHVEQSKVRLTRLQKKLQRLNKLGINYELTPVDVPARLLDKVTKSTQNC